MAVLMPLALLLHVQQRMDWLRWTIHPSTVVGLAALGGLYLWQAKRLARGEGSAAGGTGPSPAPRGASAPAVGHEGPPGAARQARFFAGLLVVFLSLNGPLHDLSDTFLFSAHMVQHLLLTLVVPPLLLSGLTAGMLRPLLRRPALAAVARVVTRPAWCFVIFNVVLAGWHLPPLYNFAMAHHPVHIAQHLMFMAAATLMWWPFLSPVPELPRLPYAGQMLYCFLLSIPMSIVSIYIVYAREVLYPAYATAARIWGISPLEDQLIGGLVMWIPGGIFFVLLMTVVFFKWASRYDDHGAGGLDDGRLAPSRR